MLTLPLYMPRAMYWPSLVQLQVVMRDDTLILLTVFCSADQMPKSEAVQLTSWCVTGL